MFQSTQPACRTKTALDDHGKVILCHVSQDVLELPDAVHPLTLILDLRVLSHEPRRIR